MIEYYNLMKSLWQEMNYYQNIQMKCSEDTAMLRKFLEREWIFKFLAGLNIEFDQVQVLVLERKICYPLIRCSLFEWRKDVEVF